MAPKPNVNPTKLGAILNYFRTSGVAHCLKDLEKSLPAVASISGMAVKDYLANLTDEGLLKVEKIGSGNWYWTFPGEEKQKKEMAVAKALEDNEKISNAIEECRTALEAAKPAKDDDEDPNARIEMATQISALEGEVDGLKVELVKYSESDPLEMKRAVESAMCLKEASYRWTERILDMERYLEGSLGLERDSMMGIKRELYGIEFENDEDGLKELLP